MDENNQYNAPEVQNAQPNTPQMGSGLAIASMVLGIVAVVFNCCFYYVTIPLGIVGLILGILSRKKNAPGKGMAIAGIVLSIIALALCVIVIIFGVVFASSILEAYNLDKFM